MMVVDPPRKGCDVKLLEAISRHTKTQFMPPTESTINAVIFKVSQTLWITNTSL